MQQGGEGRTVFLEMVLGAFIQDEYRVSRNLSISAGLRGLQVLLSPENYIRVVDARVAPIARDKE